MNINYNFSVGDNVWFLTENGVKDGKIDNINIIINKNNITIRYIILNSNYISVINIFSDDKYFYKSENEIFGTKEELIKSL